MPYALKCSKTKIYADDASLGHGELPRTEFEITEEFIKQKTCVKYMGIQIDNQLQWKEHVASVLLKVSQTIGMIGYAKKFLPAETLNCFFTDWSNHT